MYHCPYGGKVRQIMVDTDPNLLYRASISPQPTFQTLSPSRT